MPPTIHPIKLGPDCCYLLRGDGDRCVLVDAGMRGFQKTFFKALEALQVSPNSIQLLIITHCHFDHVGCAHAIRAGTGAKTVVHAAEKERLETGTSVMPKGLTPWGRVLIRVLGAVQRFVPVEPCPVDLALDDEGLDLKTYGIEGHVLHTPGHSPGSLSIILKTGEAFVGDLAMHGAPLRRGPGLPIFAEEKGLLADSWQRVLAAGARTIYPAHGRPFPAEVMWSTVSAGR